LNNMLASAEDVKPVLVNGAPQYNMLASAEDVKPVLVNGAPQYRCVVSCRLTFIPALLLCY